MGIYTYNDVCLSVIQDLNTDIVNRSLSALVMNDTTILPQNNYIPQIWERKWFNNDTLPGYQRGDVIWKYIMNGDQFLSNYASIVYKYSKENPRISAYLLCSDQYQYEKEKYHNIISGYSELSGYISVDNDILPVYRQVLPSLFDYCYDYSTKEYLSGLSQNDKPKKIEIYISLKDDNKEELSNTLYWQNINLENDNFLSTYISSIFDQEFSKHIRDYHLDGSKTSADFNELLLKKDFSNFDVNEIYNPLTVINHTSYVNSQGFDYVIKFAKTTIPSKLSGNSDDRPLYKWYRLWNSGYLEHGGIVYVPSCNSQYSADLTSYEISVDLDWIDQSGNAAPIYDYPRLTSTSFYGDQYDRLYYGNNNSSSITAVYLSSEKYLGQDNRYSVSLTPVDLIANDILSTGKYADFGSISSIAYPTYVNHDIVSTYVNVEVFRQQNESFQLIRSNTSDLTNLSVARYIQYYTSGYLTRTRLNYFLSSGYVIKDLYDKYLYDGSPVIPDIKVVTNDGYLMKQDAEYELSVDNNTLLDGQQSSTMSVYIISKYPYKGMLSGTTILSRT